MHGSRRGGTAPPGCRAFEGPNVFGSASERVPREWNSGTTQAESWMVQPHVRVQSTQGRRLIGNGPEHRPGVPPVAAQDLRHLQRVEAGLHELQPEVIVFPARYRHLAIAADVRPRGSADQ